MSGGKWRVALGAAVVFGLVSAIPSSEAAGHCWHHHHHHARFNCHNANPGAAGASKASERHGATTSSNGS